MILAGCNQSSNPAKSNAKVTTKVLKEGTSKRAVENGDAVWAVYEGRLKNGTVFDSNTDVATKAPYFFIVGESMVIKGWEQGVIGMKVGEKREISVPPELGYGEQDKGNIPPNSTLIFDLEVVGISKAKETTTYFMEDLTPGTGTEATNGKTAEVHYVAKYMNGRVVDDTRKRQQPVVFKVGVRAPTKDINKAAVGLEDGVRGMKVGGKRHLVVPPALLFGPMGKGEDMQGNQMLDIVVELVAVK